MTPQGSNYGTQNSGRTSATSLHSQYTLDPGFFSVGTFVRLPALLGLSTAAPAGYILIPAHPSTSDTSLPATTCFTKDFCKITVFPAGFPQDQSMRSYCQSAGDTIVYLSSVPGKHHQPKTNGPAEGQWEDQPS